MSPDRRIYKIAGIVIMVESDLPIYDTTFCRKMAAFETNRPENHMVRITHHFGLPDIRPEEAGRKMFERKGFSAYKNDDKWIYFIDDIDLESNPLQQVAFANQPHTRIQVFHDRVDLFKKGDLPFLSFYPTDQFFVSRVLADRGGCIFHSSGVNLGGKGLLFVGHSGAGKSTIVKMLDRRAEVLCDDRIIVRKNGDGFRLHGTWYHGEVPLFSPNSVPLKAILFLEKSTQNRLRPFSDKTDLISRLVATAIKAVKPLSTADWWEKTLALVHEITAEVPCKTLEFDTSGKVVEILEEI